MRAVEVDRGQGMVRTRMEMHVAGFILSLPYPTVRTVARLCCHSGLQIMQAFVIINK